MNQPILAPIYHAPIPQVSVFEVPFHEVRLLDESRTDVDRIGAVTKVDVHGLHLASDSCKDKKRDALRVFLWSGDGRMKARRKIQENGG